MSRTTHGQKGPGYDFWKRRLHFSSMCGYGNDVKRRCNRLHRRVARTQIVCADFIAAELTNHRTRGMTPT